MTAAAPVRAGAPRKERLIPVLRELMEEVSGLDLAGADASTTFFDMGMDSLFLTQVALTLQKRFGVKITFRQLLEDYATLAQLAEHLDSKLAADAFPEVPTEVPTAAPARPAAAAPAVPLAAAPAAVAGEPMEQVFLRQIEVISRQLEMMRGLPAGAAPAVQTAAAAPEKPRAFGAGTRIDLTSGAAFSGMQQEAFDALVRTYTERTKESKRLAQANRPHLADPRVVSGFRPPIKELVYPIVVKRSEGCRLWDVDGNEYVDFTCGFGSNFFGNGAPFIVEAVSRQLREGYEIGPQHPLTGEVAKLVCEFTGLDRAAFCNTGSEAVLGAMRLARTVTGRSTVVMFTGDYHGIFDEVVVRPGRGGKSLPAAAGIPTSAVENTLLLEYGTDETLATLQERLDDLAAILVEPVQSRKPDLQPVEFLRKLRAMTEEADTALIFDEVITGFRVHPAGAQGRFGIRADLGTYGKVIGGGLPIGVIAGRKRYMDALDGGFWQFGDKSFPEVGVTYFAGTFVRHPLALAAAKASLEYLKEKGPGLYDDLNRKADELAAAVNAHAARTGAPLKLTHFGSLLKPAFTQDLPNGDLFYVWLRNKGIHIWDHRPCFLTLAHTARDIERIVAAFGETVDEMQAAGLMPGGPPEGRTDTPPQPGARLGRDPQGNPAWFVPDPARPGKYLKLEQQP
jgi:glutamate-1-semialdehyde aminotransferase/acyl carrier protein